MAGILVVDDEEDMRSMLTQMLERAGHQVTTATDGQEAIEAFRAAPPDVLLIDVLMPIKGGLVAISEIRKGAPTARIIAMSGGGRNGKLNFLSTAQTFPGVRTVRKPFRRQQLLALVGEVLSQDA
ncbi:MAG: response regulator [Deferrisomatales bacterium]|nr:response regulator [Deferrisomatales bacterium]